MNRVSLKSQAPLCSLLMLMSIVAGCNLEDSTQRTTGSSADATFDLAQDTSDTHDEAVDLQDERPDVVDVSKDEQSRDALIDMVDEQLDAPASLPPIYRINAGGTAHFDPVLGWAEDSEEFPSDCLDQIIPSTTTITLTPSIEAAPSIPNIVQMTERAGIENPNGSNVLDYFFPVNAGQHEVDLIFSENNSNAASLGARLYSVLINNNVEVQLYDAFERVGLYKGEIVTVPVVTTEDSTGIHIRLDAWTYGATYTPRIQGIEVRSNQQAQECLSRQ